MDNYTYTYACWIITTHNKDERHSSLEKYTSHFFWKGCVWEGVGDWTELQHIDPHSIGHNRVSFPFSLVAQSGAWRPSLSVTCSSIQHLLLNCNCSIGGLRAHSAGCWFSLPHLVSNWLTSCLHPGYIIIWRPLYFQWVSQFRNHSTRPQSSF